MNLNESTSSQGLDEFLSSIPELYTADNEAGKLGRVLGCEAIERAVHDRLDTLQKGQEDWFSELREHNHSHDCDIKFITKLLCKYHYERPWVITFDFIQRVNDHQRKIGLGSVSSVSTPVIGGFQTQRQEGVAGSEFRYFVTSAQASTQSSRDFQPSPNILSEEIKNPPEDETQLAKLLADNDAALGMAGFIPPILGDLLPYEHGRLYENARYVCWREFSSHVHIAVDDDQGIKNTNVRVSFSGPTPDEIVEQISRALRGILTACSWAQDKEHKGHEIIFLRHYPGRSTVFVHEPDAVEAVCLPFGLVEDLCVTWTRCKSMLHQLVLQEQQKQPDKVPWTMKAALRLAEFFSTSTLGAIQACPSHYTQHNLEHSANDSTRQQFQCLAELQPLRFAAGEVLEFLRFKRIEVSKMLEATEILHDVALSVQFLSLAMRSLAQKCVAPVDFTFLDRPIWNFELGGTSLVPHRKVYATAQSLSCLEDMVGQKILLFSSDPLRIREPLDVLITPTLLSRLWGPAKLLTSTLSTEAVTTMGESFVDNIIGISWPGGIIIEAPRSNRQPPLWHCIPVIGSISPEELRFNPHPITNQSVIRIGAISHFHPAGPATLNIECQQNNNPKLLQYLTENSTEIGTQTPAGNLGSFQAGLQGGQFVVPQMLWTWEKSRGRSLKWNLLHPNPGFRWRIAQLEKIWGVFLSPCTGVIARVRLRDLIGYIGPRWLEEFIPRISPEDQEALEDSFQKIQCPKVPTGF
ncbi:hypothetical protein BDZ45DRAFT_456499 [Acephala macrosclerotiorum]|nr:hypothetical protein BDZ45DRAFT_456499 [Acephala macrosclerotiorum]